jgi:hypothetical protein
VNTTTKGVLAWEFEIEQAPDMVPAHGKEKAANSSSCEPSYGHAT